jgi:predicted nuclease of predicted toxin-antitoxin system
MKFIVDAHLPKKLSLFLGQKGFDSLHTLDLPNGNATSDEEINELSLKENRIVISKDSDFYNRYLIKAEPYKLIIISTGNIANSKLIELLNKNLERILEEISLNSVIEVTENSLITIL